MKIRSFAGFLLAGLCLLVAHQSHAVVFSEPESTETATEEEEVKIELKDATWEEVQKEVASHTGKIVVLDAWSTSCQPCVEEFPSLIELHHEYGEKGVVCISVSMDYSGIKKKGPDYYRPKIEKFLKSKKATIINFLCTEPCDEVYEKIDLASIPAVFVYGTDGKLAKRFDNEQIKTDADEFSYKDVEKFVEELLAK